MQATRDEIIAIMDQLSRGNMEQLLFYVYSLEADQRYHQTLYEKGLVVDELFEDREQIMEQWETVFTGMVSEQKKRDIYYDQFKWHVFSYNVVPCLQGEEAMAAFDTATKTDCYVFYQNRYGMWKFSGAKNIQATDFSTQQDIYITDVNFKWTYIQTHESQCGPYFYPVLTGGNLSVPKVKRQVQDPTSK